MLLFSAYLDYKRDTINGFVANFKYGVGNPKRIIPGTTILLMRKIAQMQL
jgi:hypothetical protein